MAFGEFMRLALRRIPEEFHGFLDDPKFHSPVWHEHSLFAHVRRVNDAAVRIFHLTGVDVRAAAEYHDVGKIILFADEVRKALTKIETGHTPKFLYFGHERISAGLARSRGADFPTVWLIKNHDKSYRPDSSAPEQFANFCGHDPDRVKALMAICAADAAGKGWTPAQKIQRPEIASRFAEVGTMLQLEAAFTSAINEALRNW